MKLYPCEINSQNKKFDFIPNNVTRPLYGFYHIYCGSNDWKGIVKEQLSVITNSGLHLNINRLYCAIIGQSNDINWVKNLFNDKLIPIETVYESQNGDCFEFPVLAKMKELAEIENFFAFYFHTKGSSYSWKDISTVNFEWKRIQSARWRMLMNYYNLYKWNIALNVLDRGYDTYGILYRKKPYPHFSGNFWWTKSEIIRSSIDLDEDFRLDRYNAEFWILNQPDIKIYSPFKRGLLLKVTKNDNRYNVLPWWHWRNLLFILFSKTLAQ